jgi:hypothetical protein
MSKTTNLFFCIILFLYLPAKLPAQTYAIQAGRLIDGLGVKVAAHAIGRNGIQAALDAGVETIEHGTGFDDALIAQAKAQGVFWCPTGGITRQVGSDRPNCTGDVG